MYEYRRQGFRIGAIGLMVLFAAMACSAMPFTADQGQAETFAVLPEGSTGPEGLTVGPDGNVYATTFGFNKDGPTVEPGHLLVFNPDGTLIREVAVKGATPHLIGLAFNPETADLIVLDFGAGVALKVDPVSGSASVFMTVSGGALMNGVTFDKAGNVYVSDSAQGIIWKTGPRGGPGAAWVSDPLLRTTGFPPFGANGIEFNNSGNALFVANTGNNTILKIEVTNGVPGKPRVLANSVTSADGIAVDRNDNIWVASNQGDEIIIIDSTGKLLARLGKFQGIDEAGAPRGLLFPASPAFSQDQKNLYVSNLSLDVRLLGLGQTIDSQWVSKVRRYTISRLPTRIPLLRDGNGEGSK
jgi:sugar lactone lactonase YvrE